MRLIGAGLPRTGTLTQKLALEQLGLGPCYHWVNVIADLELVERALLLVGASRRAGVCSSIRVDASTAFVVRLADLRS